MDAEQFRITVVPLYKGMFAAAIAILGNSDDAADAVQEAMIKLWNSRNKLDRLQSLEAYAFTTLRRTSLDILRQRQIKMDLSPNEHLEPPGDVVADVEAIAKIIESLPPNYKQVIKLNAYDGHSPEEIAKITGLSLSNIRQLLSRGRRKIKELYTKFMAL